MRIPVSDKKSETVTAMQSVRRWAWVAAGCIFIVAGPNSIDPAPLSHLGRLPILSYLQLTILMGLGVGLALRPLATEGWRFFLAWLVPILVVVALLISVYFLSNRDLSTLRRIYLLISASIYLGFWLGITFGRWGRHALGLLFLALATAAFGGGWGLTHLSPMPTGWLALGILFLIFSGLPLTFVGILFTARPVSRRLAIVAASVMTVLSVGIYGQLIVGFAFR